MVQVSIYHNLGRAQDARLWTPLVPARFRATKSLWALAIDQLIQILLPGRVRACQGNEFLHCNVL